MIPVVVAVVAVAAIAGGVIYKKRKKWQLNTGAAFTMHMSFPACNAIPIYGYTADEPSELQMIIKAE